MIVTDNVPPLIPKTSSQPPAEPPSRICSPIDPPSPPPYEGGEGPREPLLKQKGSPAIRRFMTAALIAAAIYVGIVILALNHIFGYFGRELPARPVAQDGTPVQCHIPWVTVPLMPSAATPQNTHPEPLAGPLSITLPDPPGGRPQYPDELTADTYLEVPTNSEGLYFLTRGKIYSGDIRLETYEPKHDSDKIKVNLHVTHHDWSAEAVKRINACILKKDGRDGIGIYAPVYRAGGDQRFHISITVMFPASNSSPLLFKSFATNLPLIDHELGNLEGLVAFDSVDLRATRGKIDVQSLQADDIFVASSGGRITGKFNASRSLVLSTTDALIEAEVSVRNQPNQKASSVQLSTSNGYIKANISLHSTIDEGYSVESGGWYHINAQTTNSPLFMNFPTSPVDSRLTLDAQTTNARSDIYLHSNFQGIYELSTTKGGLIVGWDDKTPDPSGRGLDRGWWGWSRSTVLYHGAVWWGDKEAGIAKGYARVKTTNAVNSLSLTPLRPFST